MPFMRRGRLGHDVIIDATGNLRRWRDLAREIIPRYAEVYLKCPIETCRKREEMRRNTRGAPKSIYQRGKEGWPVPGMTTQYEEPLNPEITIDTAKNSLAETISSILSLIDQK